MAHERHRFSANNHTPGSIAWALTMILTLFPVPSSAVIAFGAGSLGSPCNDWLPADQAGRRAEIFAKTIGGRALRIGCASVKYIDSTIGDPSAEMANSDKFVLAAGRNRLMALYLVECYYQPGDDRFDILPGGYDWYGVGRRLAYRYRPGSAWLVSQGITDWGVEVYEAFNEPDGPCYGQFVDSLVYRNALRDFALGIHSVSSSLKVIPGGYAGGGGAYLRSVLSLINSDTLNGLDIHMYSSDDFRNNGQPCWDSFLKGYIGVKDNTDLYVSECNWASNDTGAAAQDKAAKEALWLWWSLLGVARDNGQIASKMILPWNQWERNGDCSDGLMMCITRDPWKGNARGRLFQMMLWLTKGMDIVSSDQRATGEIVCEGNNRKLWVWHNRNGSTNHAGTTFTVKGIPAGAAKVEVFRYDSWVQTNAGDTGTPAPYRSVTVSGQTSVTIDNLPAEETIMFLAAGGTPGRSTYNGPHKIPGRTEAEDYDNGGEGVAYHDSDAVNNGGAYRTDGVDVKTTGDAQGGGYDVGWTETGEWMEYTIDSIKADKYDIRLRVGSAITGAQVRVKLDGAALGTISVPNLGNWNDKQIVAISGVTLAAGTNKILRLEIAGSGADINWIEVVKAATTGAGFAGRQALAGKAQMVEIISLDGRVVARGPVNLLSRTDGMPLGKGIYIVQHKGNNLTIRQSIIMGR